MASPTRPLEQAVFRNSVQSRSRHQVGYDVPIGGYDPVAFDTGIIFSLGTAIEKIPNWSIYPASRDRVLRRYWKMEPIVAGAIYSISARLKALEYKLVGDDHLHDDIHTMFRQADFNGGLRQLIEKTIQDVMTQDNGSFWELVGKGDPDGELPGGVVEGINYLDPAQCYRTFNPDYPVLYIDPMNGSRHQLHASRVIAFSNMPQPNELARNIGFSNLSRLMLSVQLMYSIQTYRREKASGQFERAIGYGTGMTQGTLRKLLQQASYEDQSSGFVRFGKIPFFTSMTGNVDLNILDLASIPDGFDLMKETEVYVNTVALAFGVDTREFWPATQTGATKADASVQAMKSRGKGLADLITMLEDTLNNYIMPEGVTFEFDFTDDEHDQQIAQQNKAVVEYLTMIHKEGGMDDSQYQAMLLHEGVLDETIMQENEEPEQEQPEPQPLVPQMPLMNTEQGQDNGQAQQPPNNMPEQLQAAMAKTQAGYNVALVQVARDFWSGILSYTGLISGYDQAVRRYIKEAVSEGAAEGGLRPGDFLPHEITMIEGWISDEQSHVLGFADYAKSLKDADKDFDILLSRIDLWVGRYPLFVTKGLALAEDPKVMWKLGGTIEHCVDCLKMDGRVYRLSTLVKYEALPQSWTLTCHGVKCQCDKVPTDEPITRGRPPKFGHAA